VSSAAATAAFATSTCSAASLSSSRARTAPARTLSPGATLISFTVPDVPKTSSRVSELCTVPAALAVAVTFPRRTVVCDVPLSAESPAATSPPASTTAAPAARKGDLRRCRRDGRFTAKILVAEGDGDPSLP
jgi:hypothetical protein